MRWGVSAAVAPGEMDADAEGAANAAAGAEAVDGTGADSGMGGDEPEGDEGDGEADGGEPGDLAGGEGLARHDEADDEVETPDDPGDDELGVADGENRYRGTDPFSTFSIIRTLYPARLQGTPPAYHLRKGFTRPLYDPLCTMPSTDARGSE